MAFLLFLHSTKSYNSEKIKKALYNLAQLGYHRKALPCAKAGTDTWY